MPFTPSYGGTNGVEELDAGQTGTVRTAQYTVRVSKVADEHRRIVNRPMQQSAAFEDLLGPGAEAWIWAGMVRVNAISTLTAIVAQIQKLRDGYTRSSGDPTSFSKAHIQPTTLKDVWGNTLTTRARLVEYTLGDIFTLSGNATYSYIAELTLRFETV